MSKDEPRAVFEASTGKAGLLIPFDVLTRWAGRELTDVEVDSIADGLSDSEVPDEIRRLAAWTENR